MAVKTKSEKNNTDPATGPVVTKVGNLCADPELRYSEKGSAYCRMRLAISVPVMPGDWAGERTTAYYGITAFGSIAENAAESLKKGDRVLVSGRGELRTWSDDEGVEHHEKSILADALGPDLRWTTVEVSRTKRTTAAAATIDYEEPF